MALEKKFVAPALSTAPPNYDMRREDQLVYQLRLYFNLLDNLLAQVVGEINDMQVPFTVQVAQGLVPGYSSFSVFGYNPDLDQVEESVWPDGGTVPHPTSASQLTIASSNAADDGSPAGTGARTVYIEGLDASYNVVSETVTMNGTTGVTTTNSYLYVNQFYVVTVGSGGANAGEITAKVSTTLYDIIGVGENQRTTGHYCVPAGYTAYLTVGLFSAGQASGTTAVTGFLKSHGTDGIVRTVAVTTLNNGAAQYDFANPIRIPEKTCIGASAIGAANNNSVSSMFNILLVQDGY
jgi:hypothetical protein